MTSENQKTIVNELEEMRENNFVLRNERDRLSRELEMARALSKKEVDILKNNIAMAEKTFEERNKENLRKFYNPKGISERANTAINDIFAIYTSIVSIPPGLIPFEFLTSMVKKMDKVIDEATDVANKCKEILKVNQKLEKIPEEKSAQTLF